MFCNITYHNSNIIITSILGVVMLSNVMILSDAVVFEIWSTLDDGNMLLHFRVI